MPAYLRKYVTLGPFRFNLSKSGIGVSAGVRGLRLGAGPSGHYVHAGRGGLYYKRSLTSANPPQPGTSRPEPIPAAEGATQTVGPMIEIDSAATTQLTDSSAADLLREINEKRKKVSLLPFPILLAVVALITLLLLRAPTWTLVPWATLSALAVIGSGYRDQIAKSVVILYDLDPRSSKHMATYETPLQPYPHAQERGTYLPQATSRTGSITLEHPQLSADNPSPSSLASLPPSRLISTRHLSLPADKPSFSLPRDCSSSTNARLALSHMPIWT